MSTSRNTGTTAAPAQEPTWRWVRIGAYELDQTFLERRLQEDFGPWRYHVQFHNDYYTLRVPEDTTDEQLRALREPRRSPRPSRHTRPGGASNRP